MSRQGLGQLGLCVYRYIFCVAIVALQCETRVFRVRVPLCRDWAGFMEVGSVSRHDLLCHDSDTSVRGWSL